jgi:hypothetical protein
MSKHKTPRSITLFGVKYTLKRVFWEDAYGQRKVQIHRDGFSFPVIETLGYAARVGNKIIVIQEINHDTGVGDVTVIPVRPEIKLEDL